MAKVGSYYRVGLLKPESPMALSSSFNTVSSPVSLNSGATSFGGHIGSIFVYVNTIAGGATKLTVRLCRDAAGDECIVPDTEATLSTGITTATDGSAVIKVDIPWAYRGSDNVYPFWKTDAGTCNMVSSAVCWRE